MKRIALLLVVGAALLLPARATYATPITFVAHLSGANEILPNNSPGTGDAAVFLDAAAHTMQLKVVFSGLTTPDTAAHIHCCLPFPFDPINIGVATTLPAFPGFPLGVTSGTYSSAVLSLMDPGTYNPAFVTLEGGIAGAEAALVAGIENGETYLNIHTQQFPGGEIRGFLVAAPAPSTFLLLGAGLAGLACVTWRRRRSGNPSPKPQGGGSNMIRVISLAIGALPLLLLAAPVEATPFFFSTGNPDGRMATASRPESAAKFEIESADDFVLTSPTSITSATFTGLLTGGATTANIGEVRVEIYRVFPFDSDVNRTSGPPTFSTPLVPTRVNSPSDVELADRDTSPAPGNLTFSTKVLSNSFTAINSVQPGGIHPKPNQTTGGNGAITGVEVEFDVTFTTPFSLPPDHYFFVPQVEITTANGEFLWLSAPRPIIPPGTPFPLGFTDLQSWTRDQFLDPDWLRVGGDIVGPTPATGPTFNATFSVTGNTIPEPATWLLLGLGMVSLVGWQRVRHRSSGDHGAGQYSPRQRSTIAVPSAQS